MGIISFHFHCQKFKVIRKYSPWEKKFDFDVKLTIFQPKLQQFKFLFQQWDLVSRLKAFVLRSHPAKTFWSPWLRDCLVNVYSTSSSAALAVFLLERRHVSSEPDKRARVCGCKVAKEIVGGSRVRRIRESERKMEARRRGECIRRKRKIEKSRVCDRERSTHAMDLERDWRRQKHPTVFPVYFLLFLGPRQHLAIFYPWVHWVKKKKHFSIVSLFPSNADTMRQIARV